MDALLPLPTMQGRGGYAAAPKMKELPVAEAGGCCRRCGYNATMGALHVHHLDPAQKRFELNAKGVAPALDTLRAEARKCVLLCSNCHAEVEERARSGPDYRFDA